MVGIVTDTGNLYAQAAVRTAGQDKEEAMRRLSTGKQLNSASDDAAGVSIASRHTLNIVALRKAMDNAADAQNLLATAEGGMVEIENILQRVRELIVQGANDTLSPDDRSKVKLEIDLLIEEIDRIAETTTWAGEVLFNGVRPAGELATTIGEVKNLNFHIGAMSNAANTVDIDLKALTSQALGIRNVEFTPDISASLLLGTKTTGEIQAKENLNDLVGRVTSHGAVPNPNNYSFALNSSSGSDAQLAINYPFNHGDVHSVDINGYTISITADENDNYENSTRGLNAQMVDEINRVAGLKDPIPSGRLTLQNVSDGTNSGLNISLNDNDYFTANKLSSGDNLRVLPGETATIEFSELKSSYAFSISNDNIRVSGDIYENFTDALQQAARDINSNSNLFATVHENSLQIENRSNSAISFDSDLAAYGRPTPSTLGFSASLTGYGEIDISSYVEISEFVDYGENVYVSEGRTSDSASISHYNEHARLSLSINGINVILPETGWPYADSLDGWSERAAYVISQNIPGVSVTDLGSGDLQIETALSIANISSTSALTASANITIQDQVVTLNGNPSVGDVYEFVIPTRALPNGKTITLELEAGDNTSIEGVLSLIKAKIDSAVQIDPNFNVNVSLNGDGSLTINEPRNSSLLIDGSTVTISGEPEEGDVFSLIIPTETIPDGKLITVTLGADDDFTLEGVATLLKEAIEQVVQEDEEFNVNVTNNNDGTLTILESHESGIEVNGSRIHITGTPMVGDIFSLMISTAEHPAGKSISLTLADGDELTPSAVASLLKSQIEAEMLLDTSFVVDVKLNDDGSLSIVESALNEIIVDSNSTANASLVKVENALSTLAEARAELGAMVNRMGSAIENLSSIAVNSELSLGRIVDADYAVEMAKFTTAQILEQAAMAMMAQANASKQQVMTLLQG